MAKDPLMVSLARWILAFDYNAIPRVVLEFAKFILLDSLGCALAAPVHSDSARQVLKTLEYLPRSEECTVIGWKRRASMEDAVFVNGLRIRALDYNDHLANDPNDGSKVSGHLSDNMAVGLAVAELYGCSGRDMLTAMVMGYELGGRFQKILGRRLPWDHTTGTGLMAPAIAGRLMGLDEQRLACALGFAMAHCLTPGSVRRGRLSAGKFLADPINARTSVFLTRMAANGVTGPVEIFEGGSTGLSEAAFPGVDFSALFAPVAKHYMIEAAALKAYPSASTSQAAITAALKVRDRLDVSSDQIDRVEVTMIDTPDVLGQISDRNRRYPTNQETADHSFHFLIAVALIDGELTFRQYGNRRWDDPRVKALMNVITVTPDKRWRERRASPFPAAIKVVTRDGREAIQEVPYALGDPHNRFSRADLVGKFTSCVVGVLDSDECQHIISTVMSLESQASISALCSMMRSN